MPIGAAAVIAIVLVGGALIMLRPNGGGVGTSPTASPDRFTDSVGVSIESQRAVRISERAVSLPPTRPSASPVSRASVPCRLRRGRATKRPASTAMAAATSSCASNTPRPEVLVSSDQHRTCREPRPSPDSVDGAVYDPATSTLSFLKGDSFVTVFAGAFSQPEANRLALERAIAELAVERVTTAP